MTGSSFRWRLALGSAALAGGVLLGFTLLSSWLIYQAKLERLDAQLRTALIPLGRLPNRGGARSSVEALLARELGVADPTTVAVLILDSGGTVQYRSDHWPRGLDGIATEPEGSQPDPWDGLPRFRGRAYRNSIRVRTQRVDRQRWRVSSVATPQAQVMVAVSLQTIRREMGAIRRIYLVTIPGALVLITGGAWWLSGRSLRPVDRLSQSINRVTAQGLDQRVPMAGVDQEFEGLIQSFNAMLERLERSFHQASRFSGDAAHELKTPLAILQGELEQAIQKADTGSPMQQTLSHLLEEVRRLSGIVRKLLLLSLADAGRMALRRDPVNLSALLEEQLEDVALLAPDLTVEPAIDSGLVVACDRDLITQVIQNLLSNAIKYNLPHGWIQVQAHQLSAGVTLTIANASHPLTVQDRAHLFDRFYRGDPARTRQTDGLGLGLSLAREIILAHGGILKLEDSPPQEVCFSLWLPSGSHAPYPGTDN